MIKTSIIKLLTLMFLLTSSSSLFGQADNSLKRAISAMEIGLFEESLKQLNNALKNEPQNAQIYKLKALLYEALSEDENSILAWKDCIRYAKDQEIINEANVHLEYLNGF
jgi:Tfp pilus assembly protein PilF